ncbi:MAG: hypothetical protein ACRD0O_00680, partial [Acidimicrobiia bacterium]
MKHLQVGIGAREVLDVPGAGTVAAVYRRAAYLRLPGGIVALVAPGVPPGPLWIRGDPVPGEAEPLPQASPAGESRSLGIDAPVSVSEDWLEVAGMRLPIAATDTWTGPLPDPARLRAGL